MVSNKSMVPDSKGEVRDKLLRFKPAGPSLEEARAAMLSAKEEATTSKGTKLPSFIVEEAKKRGETVPEGKSVLASAQEKIAALRLPQGTRVDLDKMRDAGRITQEEVDALRGVKAPAPVQATDPGVVEEVIEEPTPQAAAQPARVPQAPPAPAPQPAPETPSEPDHKFRQDEKQFTAEIYKEGREWVCELTYKNGAGTERFSASSKDEVLRKLIVAKGNASTKIRDLMRRIKLGDTPDGYDFFFRQLLESHGITQEQWDALPETSRAVIVDTIQAQQSLAFTESNPDYYQTDKNFDEMLKYLRKNDWPLTVHNLELAYRDLTEAELLQVRPVPVQPVSSVPPAAPVSSSVPPVATAPEDSAAAVAAPAPAVPTAPAPAPPAPAVRKKVLTGLVPGSSSATAEPAAPKTEEGTKATSEPSVAELKRMPIGDLQRIARKTFKSRIY